MPTGVQDQHQLRFRHIPFGVSTDSDSLCRGDDFVRHGFEKEFRPWGLINPVIGGGAEVGFLHARLLASHVRDPGGPNFLAIHWREQFHLLERMLREILIRQAVQDRNEPFQFKERG